MWGPILPGSAPAVEAVHARLPGRLGLHTAELLRPLALYQALK